jgi:hypothetical protein
MKRTLLGAFYFLQGLGNIAFGLFFIRGGLGGGGAFVDVFLRPLFVAVSCLSLLAALGLLLRRENLAQVSGELSSFFFCMFYGSVALSIYGYRPSLSVSALIVFFLSIVIIVLNVLSIFVLRYKKEGRSMKDDEAGISFKEICGNRSFGCARDVNL